jgi:Uma2 family endonuclease
MAAANFTRRHFMEMALAIAPPLRAGDNLTRAEFLRRWQDSPEIKFAELLGGIVYMPSPLSRRHGVTDNLVSTWLGIYQINTPGTEAGSNVTNLMGEDDAPQPDDYLRILPKYGGQSRNQGKYVGGSPELIAEICASSASYDLHQKLEVYERSGVLEYVAILLHEKQIRWHRLTVEGYTVVPPIKQSLWKSAVFPGLWLDGKAMLAHNGAKVFTTLQRGLRSPEHAAFVKKLARKKKS